MEYLLHLFFANCIALFFFYTVNGKACPKIPEGCPSDVIGFYLYNQQQKNEPWQLLIDDPHHSIRDAPFDSDKPIKFIIHGYTGSKDNPLMVLLRNEYLRKPNWNIVAVDYRELAQEGCYLQTTFPAVPKIGKCAATLIDLLINTREDIKVEQFHIIGFSIGAHIIAHVAHNLKSGRFERATGLDPALPLFWPGVVSSHKKLNKEHAKFVDVIHTNAGMRGVVTSEAHIDVYANGGSFQPGCKISDFSLCSHKKALEYFAESVNSEIEFYAFKCNRVLLWVGICGTNNESKKIIVGEHAVAVNQKDEGMYSLRTND